MAGFTAIAMGIGAATSVAGAGMSFAQAAKKRNLAKQADLAGVEARREAQKFMETIRSEELSVPKEVFRQEAQGALAQGAQITEAGAESERGAARTAGVVSQSQAATQRDISNRMANEITSRDRMVVGEKMQKDTQGLQASYADLAGAQLMSADMEAQAQNDIMSGIQGTLGAIETGMSMVPLFKESQAAKAFKEFDEEGFDQNLLADQIARGGEGGVADENIFKKIQNMSPMELQDYMTSNYDKTQLEEIFDLYRKNNPSL